MAKSDISGVYDIMDLVNDSTSNSNRDVFYFVDSVDPLATDFLSRSSNSNSLREDLSDTIAQNVDVIQSEEIIDECKLECELGIESNQEITTEIFRDPIPIWKDECENDNLSSTGQSSASAQNKDHSSLILSKSDTLDKGPILQHHIATRPTGIKRALLVSAVNDCDVTEKVVVQSNRHSAASTSIFLRQAPSNLNYRAQYAGSRLVHSMQKSSAITSDCNSETTLSSMDVLMDTDNTGSGHANMQTGASRRGRRPLANNQHKCDECGASYRQKRNLLRHLSSVHESREQVVNMYCLYPGCRHGCVHVDQLRRHLQDVHRVDIRTEEMNFKSWEDFKIWLYVYQKDNNSSYVISTGKQKNRDGSTLFYYNCSRSGRYKCQAKPNASVQRTRIVPTNKLGGYCPSTMKVILYATGYVHCTLWPVHFFHDLGSSHIQSLRLQGPDRDLIADRLRKGKTTSQIIKEFSSNIDPDNPTRLNFICRKDIINVRLAYDLPPSPTIYNRGRPRKNQWIQMRERHLAGLKCRDVDDQDEDESEHEDDIILDNGMSRVCPVVSSDKRLHSGSSDSDDGIDLDKPSNSEHGEGRLVIVEEEGNSGTCGGTIYCITESGQHIEVSDNFMKQMPDGSLVPISFADLTAAASSPCSSDVTTSSKLVRSNNSTSSYEPSSTWRIASVTN